MRKRGKLASFIALTAAFVFAATLLAFAAGPQAPDTVTIKAALWPAPTKAAVQFSHKLHAGEYKIACNQCHHKMESGKNVWKEGDAVEKCDKCHTEATIQGEKKLPPDQQKLNLKLAFHKQCVECHQKTKKEKPDTKAPVTCAACHPGAKAE
jgi:hypothetical protein